MTHWTDTPIHFIDFEGNTTSGVLEYGVVTLGGDAVVATCTRLCRPVGRIELRDTAVHGLAAEALEGEAPFADEWERFAALRASGPLAAHYAAVENHLLKSVWPYGRQAPDFARPGRTTTEWGAWIDTGRLYPQLVTGAGDGKLAHLIALGGLQPELEQLAERHCPPARRHYHAALYDALAGALLLLTLLRRPECADATIPWLLQMSTLDGEKRSALQQGDLF